MELLQTFDFIINENTDDLTKKYPQLYNNTFGMILNIDNDSINCSLQICYATNNLAINAYNSNGIPIQPRIWVNDNIDLLFYHGYSLMYNRNMQRFEFYKL